MKRSLVLLALALAAPAWAKQQQGVSYQDAGQLRDKLAAPSKLEDYTFALGYVVAVHDVWERRTVCSAREVTRGKLGAVVLKWINQHPERWEDPAENVVADALEKAFPCK